MNEDKEKLEEQMCPVVTCLEDIYNCQWIQMIVQDDTITSLLPPTRGGHSSSSTAAV